MTNVLAKFGVILLFSILALTTAIPSRAQVLLEPQLEASTGLTLSEEETATAIKALNGRREDALMHRNVMHGISARVPGPDGTFVRKPLSMAHAIVLHGALMTAQNPAAYALMMKIRPKLLAGVAK